MKFNSLIKPFQSLFRKRDNNVYKTSVKNPIFPGTYHYTDNNSHRHTLEIQSAFDLKIDRHSVPVQVKKTDRDEVVFVDNFGYKIEIQTNAGKPIKFYDESDNATYKLSLA